MQILDALKQLRDDIKIWAINNFNALNAKIDEKTIPIDNELSTTSTNPVQNKAIANAIKNIPRFSGDYNDLINAPNIVEDDSGNMVIADESGNIIFKADSDGMHTTALSLNGEPAATESYVDNAIGAIDFPQTDLTGYATEEFVSNAIAEIPTPDVSGQIGAHNTSEAAHEDIRQAINTAKEELSESIVAESDEWKVVDEAGNIIFSVDVSGAHTTKLTLNGENAATEAYVDEAIANIDIPEADLTGYATEQWVENKNYLTEHQDISGKSDIGHKHILEDITDLPNYATETYVDNKVADLVNSAPEALDTLGELATALENHEDAYDALLEIVGDKATKTELEDMKAELSESIVSEADEFHIVDDAGNIIASIDENGIATTTVTAQSVIVNGDNISFSGTRKYVEEFKTDSNTWDQAFELLIKYCEENTYINSADNSRGHGYVACTNNFHYTLLKPLKIGDIDVDFENCHLYNNTTFSEDNQACVILTGAQNRVQKFGTVTGRRSMGILIDSSKGLYKYNKLYAKKIQGEKHALNISSTNYACFFNEYHVPLLKAMENPLRLYCESPKKHWVNESYLYLGSIEGYRSTIPTLLISMTNISRCNIYNVDLECGQSDQSNPDPNHTVGVELTNCNDVAFYNPRTKEPYNAVQFRFIGESFDNYIDAEYCKYGTIDSSQMVDSCNHYNIWRGRAITNNSGCTTNMDTLRIYKDMIIPEILSPMIRKVTNSITIDGSLLKSNIKQENSNLMVGGIPTLIKWYGGDITINKKFIALLPATIKIVKADNEVGNILDENGNVIKIGSELELNKFYDIDINNIIYADNEPYGESAKVYQYIDDVELLIGESLSTETKEEQAIILISPNGTKFNISIDDNGILTSTEIVES